MISPVSVQPDQPHHAILGVSLKLVSVLCLAAMAACVKYLGEFVPPGQIVFFRGTLSVLAIAAYAWHRGELGLLRARNWRAHAYRSLAGSMSMFCWFVALTLIPLAQMTAISFTIPLFLTVLAMVFLRESSCTSRSL
jgi:drug/metabolite transporter (DMT)-like permease